MAQLQWKDSPDEALTQKHPASIAASANNPWFAVTVGLVGVIVGYIIGNF